MAGKASARQDGVGGLEQPAAAPRSPAIRLQATSADPAEVGGLLAFLGEVAVTQDCLGRFFFEFGALDIGGLVAFRLRFDCAATIAWRRVDGVAYLQSADDASSNADAAGVLAKTGTALRCAPYATLVGVAAPRGTRNRRVGGEVAIALPRPTPARSARMLAASLDALFADPGAVDAGAEDRAERLAALLAATIADLTPEPPSALQRIERHIAENLGGDLSATALAEAGGVSVRSLTRLFQEHFETTPRRYVAQVRMEAACRLRREAPGVSLRKLALTLGYTDYSSFWRHFNAHFGRSPRRAIG